MGWKTHARYALDEDTMTPLKNNTGRSKKKANTTKTEPVASTSKKPRSSASVLISIKHPNTSGTVLAVGTNDSGQLGIKSSCAYRKRPAIVSSLEDKEIVQVYAGAMHTLCLTKNGKVYSFGCNDEHALGRDTSEEGSECIPEIVNIEEPIVRVCGGDSHSAALGQNGMIYIWGNFRDGQGKLGLMRLDETEPTPVEASSMSNFVHIVSGDSHILALTENGDVYSMGRGEQGQLGRLSKQFCTRGSRDPETKLLTLQRIRASKRDLRFSNIFAGGDTSFAIERTQGTVYAWGLNNFHQLGFQLETEEETCYFMPQIVADLRDIKMISGGQHHTLALKNNGDVLSFGRGHGNDGRLGYPDAPDTAPPTHLESIDSPCKAIDAGNVVSYAIQNDGSVLSFGMGVNTQLSTDTEDSDEDVLTPQPMIGQNLVGKYCLQLSAGGQHTVLLVTTQDRSDSNDNRCGDFKR